MKPKTDAHGRRPKPDPYGYTLEDKQFLTSVMLYMMCSQHGGTPRDVMLDDIDSWVQYFMEFDNPWTQLEKEMKQYD